MPESFHNQNHDFFTPFSEPNQEYDAQIGLFRLKAYRYRLMTFIFILLSIFLSLYFLQLSEKPREKVIAVQVLNTGVSTGVVRLPLGPLTLLEKGEGK